MSKDDQPTVMVNDTFYTQADLEADPNINTDYAAWGITITPLND